MVNYTYSDLFKEDSINKQLNIYSNTISLDSNDIYSESLELNESLCSEEQLKIGSCESSYIKFTVANNYTSLIGQYINVDMILDNHTEEPFRVGTYKVVEDKLTADRSKREVVAYDRLYDITQTNFISWYNSLHFPLTLKSFRNSFFSNIGLDQETVDLCNDSMQIEKTIDAEVLSGADILNKLCEINGVYGHITRDNKFRYVFLNEIIDGLFPQNDLYPENTLYPVQSNVSDDVTRSLYISAKYEDYEVQSITRLQIRTEENDIGAVVGTVGNNYVVEDNFLVYGKTAVELTTIATNLLNVIRKIKYKPLEVETLGNLCLEVGDIIRVYTTNDICVSYILKRELKGIQALRDALSSQGEEYYKEQINGSNGSFLQLKGKTNTLIRTVSELRSTIADVESGLRSEITQTANEINQKVSDLKTDTEAELSTQAREISAKVSKSGGQASSFGWSLTDTEFKLTSNNNDVFKCNASGVSISGYVNATSGSIGGCSIVDGQLKVGSANIGQISADSITTGTLNIEGVTWSGAFGTNQIPSLNTSKITEGNWAPSRVSNGTVNGYDVKWQRFEYVTGLNWTPVYQVGSYLSTSGVASQLAGYIVNSIRTDHLYSLCKTNA